MNHLATLAIASAIVLPGLPGCDDPSLRLPLTACLHGAALPPPPARYGKVLFAHPGGEINAWSSDLDLSSASSATAPERVARLAHDLATERAYGHPREWMTARDAITAAPTRAEALALAAVIYHELGTDAVVDDLETLAMVAGTSARLVPPGLDGFISRVAPHEALAIILERVDPRRLLNTQDTDRFPEALLAVMADILDGSPGLWGPRVEAFVSALRDHPRPTVRMQARELKEAMAPRPPPTPLTRARGSSTP